MIWLSWGRIYLLFQDVAYYTTIMLMIPHLQQNVPLAPYTTYKIGGPADFFVTVSSQEELMHAVKSARSEGIPYFILGAGANILIQDKGLRGLVIHNKTNHIDMLSDYKIQAESGAIIKDLIQLTCDHGWSGLEHFVGIPSTVGGAIWQNLHFLSPDRKETLYIASIVDSADVLLKDNRRETVTRDFFRFGYDDSILHHEEVIVLNVTFQLSPKSPESIQKQMDENMAWRIAKQPQLDEYPSCGSVFKKIEGVGAGRLIDQVGLKGKRIGGAMISEKHANYIVNLGNATASNVIALIRLVQDEVKQQLGYELEPEISIVGEV
jgi:UDP-N-acetylmuramate dehydrogenase